MPLPEERKFVTFRRGKVRDDIILARFRNTLRGKLNPDTNQAFTEDEIAIITQVDSRFYIEADAIDLYGQATQQRAIWFADQVRPERAASGWLRGFHGDLWLPDGLLAATGGSGPVLATGSPGTIFTGSTTLGDPTANLARDPAGKRYQVLVTQAADANGETTLQMQAIDPGDDTDLPNETVLTWINPPLGADTEATTSAIFTGGFNEETEDEFSTRIIRRIRNKPGAGNSAQFRFWAQQASNAVADAFVFPTALHAGSVIVTPMQKRGNTLGPLARLASVGTLTAVTAFLIPPTSPVVPHGIHVLVTTFNPEPTDMALVLAMPRGSSGGWTDTSPWPRYSVGFNEGVKILVVVTQLAIRIETDEVIAGLLVGNSISGADLPALMIWDDSISRFETLDVALIVRSVTNFYDITLNNAPNMTMVVGDLVSPKNERAVVISESFEDYFDELGPGELVPSDDVRFVRAARFPPPDQEFSTRAGQSIIARLDDQLGGALSDAELEFISQNAPTVPAENDIVGGPSMLTLGKVGIYAAEF